MPLKILRHKDWNVWNKENREKVLGDERKHEEEENEKLDYQRRANLEKRRELLKAKAAKTICITDNQKMKQIEDKPAKKNQLINKAPINTAIVEKPLVVKPAYEIKEITPIPFTVAREDHFTLFKSEDDFQAVLGKTKAEGQNNQFKKYQLPTNDEYEVRKKIFLERKREG